LPQIAFKNGAHQQYIQQRITITISKMNTTYTND